MAINKLQAGDKLRFEDLSTAIIATISTIVGDTVEETLSEADVEIIVPVYGDPYLKFTNNVASKFSKGSINIESTLSEFEALDAIVLSDSMKVVRLVIGGSTIPEYEFMKCVITGVSVKKHLMKGDNWVTGQISFIKVGG